MDWDDLEISFLRWGWILTGIPILVWYFQHTKITITILRRRCKVDNALKLFGAMTIIVILIIGALFGIASIISACKGPTPMNFTVYTVPGGSLVRPQDESPAPPAWQPIPNYPNIPSPSPIPEFVYDTRLQRWVKNPYWRPGAPGALEAGSKGPGPGDGPVDNRIRGEGEDSTKPPTPTPDESS